MSHIDVNSAGVKMMASEFVTTFLTFETLKQEVSLSFEYRYAFNIRFIRLNFIRQSTHKKFHSKRISYSKPAKS